MNGPSNASWRIQATAQFGKGILQTDKLVAQQIICFHYPYSLQVLFQAIACIDFGSNLFAAQFVLQVSTAQQYSHGKWQGYKHGNGHLPIYP